MKGLIISLMVWFAFAVPILAQTLYPITVQKKGMAKYYIQNGRRLDRKELKTVITGYSESGAVFKKASLNSGIGMSLVAGGCLVIGTSSLINTLKELDELNHGSFGKPRSNAGPFLAGCGMAVTGLSFLLIGNSQFIRSINIYNSQSVIKGETRATVALIVTPSGTGLRLVF